MQSSTKGRINYIDVAKGIGIILVVFAHIDHSEPLQTVIYSFHMPLFFVLAGMVMRVDKYQNLKYLIKDKFRKMIPQYLLFCFLGILVISLLKIFVSVRDNVPWTDAGSFFGNAIYSVFWAPYSLKYFNTFNTPMWFVPCLVLLELMYYLICRICKGNKIYIAVFSLAVTVFGWVMEADLIPFDFSVLPWNFSSACFALGFFATGNITYPYVKRFFNSKDRKTLIIIYVLGFISACIMVITGWINGKVSMGSRVLGNGLLFYISGICGTVFVLSLSKLLENIRILQFTGRNSFTVMGCHLLIYSVVPTLIKIVKTVIPIVGKIENTVFYFVVTLLLSLIFTLLYNKVLPKIKSVGPRKAEISCNV